MTLTPSLFFLKENVLSVKNTNKPNKMKMLGKIGWEGRGLFGGGMLKLKIAKHTALKNGGFMLPDEYLKAIGRITVNFESLSFRISFFIWALLKVNQHQGMAITSESSFAKICDLLVSLAKIEELNFEPKEIKEIENLISRASQAEQNRNSIIHSLWIIDDSSKQVSRLKISSKRKNGLKSANPNVTPEELNQIADDLKEIANEFFQIFQKLKSQGKVCFPSEEFPIP